jgi:hypothetical protein
MGNHVQSGGRGDTGPAELLQAQAITGWHRADQDQSMPPAEPEGTLLQEEPEDVE